MPKIKTIRLTKEGKKELIKGYKEGKTHAYRKRCQMILLKADKRKSKEVADILDCCEVSVNNWLKRYEAEGIHGLKTKAGRGRKSILNTETDIEAVKKAVQNNRQRISLAKLELERELGKEFSIRTLHRFLKNLMLVSNELDGVPTNSLTR